MDKEKNIKQLVIIGNGFDLQCGLKSKFTDYFNYVKSKMNEQDETLLKGNEINYGNTLPHSEFYLNFASFWDCYFLSLELLEDNQDYDWCNVEKQIEILLTSNKNENIGEINGKILFDLLYLGSLNGLTNLKFHSQLNNMLKKQIKSKIQNGNQISLVENIINKLSFYISLSLDKGIQDNLKNNDNLNELISNYKPIFYSYLFKQLEKFENNLKAYLQLLFQKKESTDSKANKENNAISCSEVAMDFSYYLQCYRKILYKITEGNKYNLLSFNYTYFSKALLSTTLSLGMISPVVERMHPINCVVSKNIHGDLDGHIIIGIDELSINESDPFVRFLVLKTNLNTKFIEQLINNINFFIESTGVPQLTVPQLSNYSIFVPNKSEQYKIGLIFNQLDSLITLYERNFIEKIMVLSFLIANKVYKMIY